MAAMTPSIALLPATAEPAPRATPGANADAPGFDALLQTLQRLTAIDRAAPPVADAEQLQTALQRADDSFTTAMELRRQLEAAYRDRLR
jgi:hypothetical protein